MPELVLHSHGARIGLRAPAGLADTVVAAINDVAVVGTGPVDDELVLHRQGCGWSIRRAGHDELDDGPHPDDLVANVVVDRLHKLISVHARDVVFVHAGVIGHDDRVVMVPGRSHSGKTSLVLAAIEAGWHYWSDEFAVVDHDGMVHPYPRPLGVRLPDGRTTPVPLIDVGGEVGARPASVAAIVVTRFVDGANWNPQTVYGSAAALPIIDNAVRAQLDPHAVLRSSAAIVDRRTPAYVGERGDAVQVVDRLAELLGATSR